MSESPRVTLPSLPILCLGAVVVLVFVVGFATGPVVADGELSDTSSLPSETSTADSDFTLIDAAQNESALIESNTSFVVQLQSDGDAQWRITERFNLSSDEQEEMFRELASNFESGDAEGSDLGFESFERASELINEETDRDMAVTGEERTSSVDGDTGELTLSFTWENFARSEDNRLVLDDVYETESGIWFSGLTQSQELTIKSPSGFGFDDATVVPSGGDLHWSGPETFTNESLQALLIGNDGNGTPTNNGTDDPVETNGSGSGSTFGLVALLIGGIGAVTVILVIAVVAIGTERLQTVLISEEAEEPQSGESDGETDATTSAAPAEPDSEQDIDVELLSDEERVERLLEQNEGRMKQASIVKETGWSNAKVSQLLSSMEEEDRIDKLRIGRENLISFPDEDITEIGDK